MKPYFYAVGDEKRGPVEEGALRELFRSGLVTAGTLVWAEGMTNWEALGSVFPQWLTETSPTSSAEAGVEQAQCAVTGRWLPKSEMIQFGAVFVAPEARDLYLQRLQQGVSLSGDDFESRFIPATIWQRFGASVIDSIILGLPILLLIALSVMVSPKESDDANLWFGAISVLGVVLVAAYEITLIKYKGATLGKMALKMEVVTVTGERPGWGTAVGRFALKGLVARAPLVGALYSLVSIIMALADTPWRRAIHDRGASTRVVQRRL